MKRLLLIAALATVGCAAVAAARSGSHPHVESDAIVGSTEVHQEITVWGRDTMHYWIRVRDSAGVKPFCMTFQFERKATDEWRRAGGKDGRDHACCPDPNPDEACGSRPEEAGWDLFLYPRRSLRDDVQSGRLRMRGFSDFGPSIVLRLNGPLL